jgi:uncharacterized damage-inducible protein DinB
VTPSLPEPWLRGPIPEIPALLQPPAHAFIMSREDVEAAAAGLAVEQLWREPGGIASVGFHLAHLTGSTDRLLTYARGEMLSDRQKHTLMGEGTLSAARPALADLVAAWHDMVEKALSQLSSTTDATLLEPRYVGRLQLPSTVLGLLFHAAEHAARHTGQIVTTAKLVRVNLP